MPFRWALRSPSATGSLSPYPPLSVALSADRAQDVALKQNLQTSPNMQPARFPPEPGFFQNPRGEGAIPFLFNKSNFSNWRLIVFYLKSHQLMFHLIFCAFCAQKFWSVRTFFTNFPRI